MMYRISKYWNRIVYFFIMLLVKCIWDYTDRNSDILKEPCNKYTRDIMTAL